MTAAEGLALAYLKIGVLAAAIMAAVGVVCWLSVALHRRGEGPADGNGPDDGD